MWQTLRHPDGQWIFGASSARGRPDSLLRVYTGTFAPTETAFGRASEFVDENPVSRITVAQHVGNLGVTREGGLLFAPYLYEGEVAEYVRTDGAWTRADTWRGYVERGAYDYEKVSADAPAKEAQIHTTYTGVFNAVYYNKSLGLFRRGGRVFHFTSIARGEHRLFGAEVYRPDGTMQGYVPLKEVPTDENGVPTEVTPTPEAVGPDGAFHLIEKGYDAVPKILVLSLRVDGTE